MDLLAQLQCITFSKTTSTQQQVPRDGKSLQNSKRKSSNFENFAHKIFAKNAQNHAKFAKMPKIAQKKGKYI